MANKYPFQQHPYYPNSLQLPGWQPLVLPFDRILAVFFGGAGIIGLISYFSSGWAKHLKRTDRGVLTWWTITGVIHFLVEGDDVGFGKLERRVCPSSLQAPDPFNSREPRILDLHKSEIQDRAGYVVAAPKFYTETSGNPLGEIWKEYAKADSRYASRDAFTICMEFFTAFIEGPLCFVIVYGLARNAPWRHVLQLLVASCQVYGDVLYFGTSWYEGWVYSRPEALYFWFYFVFVNSIWIAIPSLCAGRAAKAIIQSVAASDRVAFEKKQ